MPENRFTRLFAEADAAFSGKYKDELNKLIGMSKEEVLSATPGTTDLKTYSVLIKLVEKASKDNLDEAKLMKNIKELGDVAVKIAMKIPMFASLL